METFLDALLDALVDTAKLAPFLFVTYLVMELVEHRAGDRSRRVMERAGAFGPAVGALLGAVPQCGFSASAAGLYSGGVVTAGTLVAVFVSTSDEMIPLMLSSDRPGAILKVVGIKILIALILGFALDLALRLMKKQPRKHVEELCAHDHCHCERGVVRSALIHTLEIVAFIFAINLALNIVVETVGESAVEAFLSSSPVLAPVAAALVGLIPNCAASVLLTRLALSGILSAGAAVGGLVTGSGLGLLVLFRTNRPHRENFLFAAFLFVSGIASGLILDALGFAL